MQKHFWIVLVALVFASPLGASKDPGFGGSSGALSRSTQSGPAIAVPLVPSPEPRSSDEEPRAPIDTLEISARSFFTFLQYPNPAMRGVVGVRDDARLIWVRRSGINQTISGEKMREFLLSLFRPDENLVFRFASPVVFADGPFGRVSRKFSIEEIGRNPECVTFYGEALHQRETGWQFTQLTMVMGERFKPCEISVP